MEKFEKKKKEYTKRSSSNRDDDEGGRGGRDDDKKGGGNWRRRERPALDLIIDYKDVETLRPFLSEGGRLVPARVNRLNRKQQKVLASEVKRARHLALVPISDRHSAHR
jgi:small subunit ribosomal protein S18